MVSPSVPRMLRQANCEHCRNKYGQVPVFSYNLKIDLIVIVLLVVAFVLQSGIPFVLAFVPILFNVMTPYSKLDDRGKLREINTDLLCEFVIIDTYDKIKRDELYFLDNRFDKLEIFSLASPIQVHYISKKDDAVSGEFLYMHEKNYNYMRKESCELYNTDMELVARIKFVTDEYTIS